MGGEAKREEEDRKRKEEEARRKEHVKKWLRSKKVKREENKKNTLEVKSSREGGTIFPVDRGPHQHPEIAIEEEFVERGWETGANFRGVTSLGEGMRVGVVPEC